MTAVRCEEWPKVLPNDDGIRPAGKSDECFYCRQKVGQPHGRKCVCVNKRVSYLVFAEGRQVGTFTRLDPWFWSVHDCEFHKNDSSWCSDNALDEIVWTDEATKAKAEAMSTETTCTCWYLEFSHLEDVDPGPLVILRASVKKRGPETPAERIAADTMTLEEYDALYDNGCSVCRDPNCSDPGGHH